MTLKELCEKNQSKLSDKEKDRGIRDIKSIAKKIFRKISNNAECVNKENEEIKTTEQNKETE